MSTQATDKATPKDTPKKKRKLKPLTPEQIISSLNSMEAPDVRNIRDNCDKRLADLKEYYAKKMEEIG